jgi:inner membrane protein
MAVFGAVIPDIDILLIRFTNRHPEMYIFTHGGFTHSISGCLFLCTIAFLPFSMVWQVISGSSAVTEQTTLVLGAMVIGALTHVFFDFLAYPGIPLTYPLTDTKMTAGIFPGPPLPLFALSLFTLVWSVLGAAPGLVLSLFSVLFCLYTGVMVALKVVAAIRIPGRTIPTLNPLHWLALEISTSTCTIRKWDLIHGPGDKRVYQRHQGVTGSDLAGMMNLPEVRRMVYTSYAVVASGTEDRVTLRDPVRSDGFIPYPPWFLELEVPVAAIKRNGGPPDSKQENQGT